MAKIFICCLFVAVLTVPLFAEELEDTSIQNDPECVESECFKTKQDEATSQDEEEKELQPNQSQDEQQNEQESMLDEEEDSHETQSAQDQADTTVKQDPWFGRRGGSSRRRSFGGGWRRRSVRRRSWRRRNVRRRSWRRRSVRRRSWRRRNIRRRSIRRRSWRRRNVRRRTWRRRTVRRRSVRRRTWRRRTIRRRTVRRRTWRRRATRRRAVRRRSLRRRTIRRRTVRRRTSRRRTNTKSYLKVSKGQITFNSEGNDNKNSRYFSRKPHVPSKWSGVTVGRGYDMKYKSQKQVYNDLVKAGFSKTDATKLSKGAKLSGQKARDFVKKNLNNYVMTGKQQKELFKISYNRQEAEAKRLTTKYYKTNWNNMNSKIKEVLTDMKFRGDLLPTSTRPGQVALKKAVKANDLKKVKQVLGNRGYWKNVPKDRFDRRVKFLNGNSG